MSTKIRRFECVQKASLDLLSSRESEEYGIETPNRAKYSSGTFLVDPMSAKTRWASRNGSQAWTCRKNRAVNENTKSAGGFFSTTALVFSNVVIGNDSGSRRGAEARDIGFWDMAIVVSTVGERVLCRCTSPETREPSCTCTRFASASSLSASSQFPFK